MGSLPAAEVVKPPRSRSATATPTAAATAHPDPDPTARQPDLSVSSRLVPCRDRSLDRAVPTASRTRSERRVCRSPAGCCHAVRCCHVARGASTPSVPDLLDSDRRSNLPARPISAAPRCRVDAPVAPPVSLAALAAPPGAGALLAFAALAAFAGEGRPPIRSRRTVGGAASGRRNSGQRLGNRRMVRRGRDDHGPLPQVPPLVPSHDREQHEPRRRSTIRRPGSTLRRSARRPV